MFYKFNMFDDDLTKTKINLILILNFFLSGVRYMFMESKNPYKPKLNYFQTTIQYSPRIYDLKNNCLG